MEMVIKSDNSFCFILLSVFLALTVHKTHLSSKRKKNPSLFPQYLLSFQRNAFYCSQISIIERRLHHPWKLDPNRSKSVRSSYIF